MPCLRQVSPTFAPASTSFRIRTICSSLNFDFSMQSSSGGNSTSNWLESARALHGRNSQLQANRDQLGSYGWDFNLIPLGSRGRLCTLYELRNRHVAEFHCSRPYRLEVPTGNRSLLYAESPQIAVRGRSRV